MLEGRGVGSKSSSLEMMLRFEEEGQPMGTGLLDDLVLSDC